MPLVKPWQSAQSKTSAQNKTQKMVLSQTSQYFWWVVPFVPPHLVRTTVSPVSCKPNVVSSGYKDYIVLCYHGMGSFTYTTTSHSSSLVKPTSSVGRKEKDEINVPIALGAFRDKSVGLQGLHRFILPRNGLIYINSTSSALALCWNKSKPRRQLFRFWLILN